MENHTTVYFCSSARSEHGMWVEGREGGLLAMVVRRAANVKAPRTGTRVGRACDVVGVQTTRLERMGRERIHSEDQRTMIVKCEKRHFPTARASPEG